MKLLAVIAFCLLFAFVSAGQERFVKPVDEAKQSASFLAFRKKLIAAVERKDTKFIYSILDRNIKLSFGTESGLADFKTMWEIEKKDSRFWDEFSRVINNGGAFAGEGRGRLNSFNAPYTHTSWPDDIDAFEYSVIFGNNVNLRAEPSMEGKILDRLSYNVVKPTETKMKGEIRDWTKIESLGGKTGWIKAEYVRSPIDYRAGFERKRGVWKMTFFLAGD